jgi:ATP-dependent Lon protease
MDKNSLVQLVKYIVEQGVKAIRSNTVEKQFTIDYVAIFSKNEEEFESLLKVGETIGEEIDKEMAKTGKTFLLNEKIETIAGELSFVKIRKPDPTRPQRGAPDFKVQNYQQFKNKYLQTSGNFTLMVRATYKMIEIKGVDVLVYIPSKTLSERMLSSR